MRQLVAEVIRLQSFPTTNAFIFGESGTGKELVARALHFGSARSAGPFLPVSCAAIPSDLAESTFFGHVRGAFTDAQSDRKGYFEMASGGTLFLDEVGDMPLSLQAKMLRILEEGCVTPVGTTQARKIDVRVLAATNSDIQRKIFERQFRGDLYFRLAGYTIVLPALRDRREDIPSLVHHFISTLAKETNLPEPRMSKEALAALALYDYQGNIRELKQIVRRAIIRSDRGEIGPEHLCLLCPKLPERWDVTGENSAPSALPDVSIEECYRRLIEEGQCFWRTVADPYLDRQLNRGQVQWLVGQGLRRAGTFRELLKLFGIPPEQYLKFMDFLRHHRLKPHRDRGQGGNTRSMYGDDQASFAATERPIGAGASA